MQVIQHALSTVRSCVVRHPILWPFVNPAIWLRAVTTPPRFPVRSLVAADRTVVTPNDHGDAAPCHVEITLRRDPNR
jgi:hypothetical protein